jgi:hypothetical protein
VDAPRLDALARAVSSGASRRQTLRWLAAGAFAGLLPWPARAALAAQADGCEPGLTRCGLSAEASYCTDLTNDYSNCGACGIECPYSDPNGLRYVCIGGTCLEAGCAIGLSYCTDIGACVDLGYDANNCGACGNACASGVCQAGVCAEEDTMCAAGFTSCPANELGQPAGCYDLSSDYTHCGACDASCPIASAGPMACLGGACQPHCEPPLTLCEAPQSIHPLYCADFSADPENCGGCGNVCASGVCEAWTCQ